MFTLNIMFTLKNKNGPFTSSRAPHIHSLPPPPHAQCPALSLQPAGISTEPREAGGSAKASHQGLLTLHTSTTVLMRLSSGGVKTGKLAWSTGAGGFSRPPGLLPLMAMASENALSRSALLPGPGVPVLQGSASSGVYPAADLSSALHRAEKCGDRASPLRWHQPPWRDVRRVRGLKEYFISLPYFTAKKTKTRGTKKENHSASSRPQAPVICPLQQS